MNKLIGITFYLLPWIIILTIIGFVIGVKPVLIVVGVMILAITIILFCILCVALSDYFFTKGD